MSCYTYNCQSGCCNYYGYCPENYSSLSYNYFYTTCWYYYDDYSSTANIATIAGAVVGAVMGAIVVLMIVCYIRNRQRGVGNAGFEHSGSIGPCNEPTIMSPSIQLKYGQPMCQTNLYGGSYGQTYGQPGYLHSYNQSSNGWFSSTPFAHQNGVYGATQQPYGINPGPEPIIM